MIGVVMPITVIYLIALFRSDGPNPNNEYYPIFSQKMLATKKWGVNSGYINLELIEKEVISNGRRVS
jgi:hypothetical protein